jgi:hypothetical protein
VREHAAQREERARHAEPGIAERGAERGEAPERQARRSDHRMRSEHADQRDVHEEALGRALALGELAVLEVAGDDAAAVRKNDVRSCGKTAS